MENSQGTCSCFGWNICPLHATKPSPRSGELLGFEVTHYLEGFYWLNDGIEIQSDVSLLEARWEEYSRRDTSSEEWLNLANMCQGYYLPGIKWVGIEQRREHVHNLQASILIRAATILQLDQPEGTLSLLQKALKLAPYRDDAVRLQMWTYIHLGQPTAAKALFEAYYEKVQNELGTNAKPDRQLFTLYNQLSA
jgi:two-component SAPR family response regulator